MTVYTQPELAQTWLERQHQRPPVFACLLGFTATGLIDGISAAGKTPQDRRYTAIADAEFLINGHGSCPQYPLPPLTSGVSPVVITRALLESLSIPVYLFNTGLPIPPAVAAIDLGGAPAQCLSTGRALPKALVKALGQRGWQWGQKLAGQYPGRYLILSECVVGGTTTALALLTALGIPAQGKINSSHIQCNHAQKWQIVQKGLAQAPPLLDPWDCVAALGDPMQIVCAAMALAASQTVDVLLAGGTQMLAVYALMRALAPHLALQPAWERLAVGTTRWVAEDPSGDTVGLARLLEPAILLATSLNFALSPYPALRAYEQGFVKEGVGAGGAAIAASLYRDWDQAQLLRVIEAMVQRCLG